MLDLLYLLYRLGFWWYIDNCTGDITFSINRGLNSIQRAESIRKFEFSRYMYLRIDSFMSIKVFF